MINEIYLTSCAISLVSLVLAYMVFRRAGLMRFEALLFASPFFTGPLFIAIRGAGSYIFLCDLAIPFLAISAVRRRGELSPGVKLICGSLLFGTAVMPLFVSAVGAFADRHQMLFTLINSYRLVGTASLIACGATCRVRSSRATAFHSGTALLAFSGLALVLIGAMVLQGMGIVDSNTFYRWEGSRTLYEEQAGGYAVVGLFRGSLGIIGTMALAAVFAVRGRMRWREIGIVLGAICGIGVVLGTSSKTSLFVCFGLGGLGVFLVIRQLSFGKIALMLLFGLSATTALYQFFDVLPPHVQKVIVGVLEGDERQYGTWLDRMSRFSGTLEVVAQNPEIAFGLGLDPRFIGARWAYYHNEYIAVFMHGGVFSFTPYLLFILLLMITLLRRAIHGYPLPAFALLVLASGVVQGVSVAHILPGIFFGSASALFGLAYGLGLHPLAITDRSVATLAQFTEFDTPESYFQQT